MLIYLLFELPLVFCWYYGRDAPNRWTVGGVFPLPEQISYGKTNRSLDPTKIGFNLGDKFDCDILRVNSENYCKPIFINESTFSEQMDVSLPCDSERNCRRFCYLRKNKRRLSNWHP